MQSGSKRVATYQCEECGGTRDPRERGPETPPRCRGRLMKERVVLGMHAKNNWPSCAKEARDFVAIGK